MPDDSLLEMAEAVADGRPVDWTVAESAASSDDDLEGIRQLRVIAEIGALHRRFSDQGDEPSGPDTHVTRQVASVGIDPRRSAADPAQRRWGGLLVLEKLGAGSFGDVFRAWDTTLDREVALKLLRRRSRRRAESIIREGQLLARISHPNVMAIHGAQEIEDQVGIWGELLKGRTLERLVRDEGPLSADETLVACDSICRALAAVHRAGLLHRDVKAQNVMRERGGRIVLMDFGLGQQLDEIPPEQALDLAGTPLYMAPELFTGARSSVQSDLYSLGVLMFHLATGSYPVTATRVSEIAEKHRIGRALKLQDLRPELSTPFVQVVERALQTDPLQRFESAGAMQAAITTASQPLPPRAAGRRGLAALRDPIVGAALAVAVLLSAIAGAWMAMTMRSQPPTRVARGPLLLAIEPPLGTRFSDSARNMPAISPDGHYVAFSAADVSTGTINLWLHALDRAEGRVVAGSQGALAPFWAPDSKSLGFFEPGGTVKRVTIEGVALGTVEIGQEPRGAALNGQGVLLFPRGPRSGLYALSTTSGAEPERLVMAPDAARGELGYTWPQFLPDGQRFIYFVLSNDPNVRGVYLASLDGALGRRLANTDASGVVAGDRLLYVKEGELVAQRFVAVDGRTEGTPSPVMLDVAVAFDWRSVVTAADDGTLVFLPAMEETELVWLDPTGAHVGSLAVPPARYRSPALSRDGRLVAVQRYRDGLSEIQVFDADSGQARPGPAHSADVQFPVWGPGHKLAYASGDTGRMDIYIKDFDRDDPPRRIDLGQADPADSDKMPTDWSPDGQHLVAAHRSIDRRYHLWVLPVERPAEARPLRSGEGSQYGGRLSPDGRSIIYVRRVRPLREGAPPERELWACDFPSGANPRLIAVGGIDPSWPSNRTVSFLDRAGRMTLLRVPAAAPRAAPLAVFPTGVDTPEGSRNSYAWALDGRRVLVNRAVAAADRRRVMLLLAGE